MGFSKEESSNVKVYKGKGCSKCDGIGAKGRRGIYEVFRVTENIKSAILLNKTTMEILEIAQRKDGFRTMQEIGRDLLTEGVSSLEEYQRVMMVN